MPAERVIYVVADCDEVPMRAFTDLEAAEAVVAANPGLHIVTIPLGVLGGEDGS